MEMSVASYGNFALFIVNSCIGSVFILAISGLVNKFTLFEYIGKNTIAILGIHGFAISTVSVLCRTVGLHGIALYCIVFAVTMIASCACAFIIDCVAPNLNGK